MLTRKQIEKIALKTGYRYLPRRGTTYRQCSLAWFIESDNKRAVAGLHDSYQEKIPRKLSPIILDSSEFRNLEVKDRPLYESINRGKVIHEAE